MLTDKMQLFFVELPMVDKIQEAENITKLCFQFFKADSQEDLDMLTNSGVPEIQKAVETIKTINDDPKTRAEAWAREKAVNDYISEMTHAREEGRAEGRAEARAEVIKEIAKAMKQMGADMNFIAKATGLSLAEIEKL